MTRYWFKARRYGYGWTPSTWEGWAIVALWFVALLRLLFVFAERSSQTGEASNVGWFVPLVFLITAALVWIGWLKGEPARWRWGDRK